MHRVLLVEDALSSQKVVEAALAGSGIELTVAPTCEEALRLTSGETAYQLILLDLSLPDGKGLSLLKAWHDHPVMRHTPVLLLTGTADEDTKVEAFTLGADDYLVKPVSPRELKARIEARLRRREDPPATLRRGRLVLHFPVMRATLVENGSETPVELTAKEFRLVALLAKNEGQVLRRSELVREIWGKDMNVVSRTVDSHICGARRKLGPAGDYIESVTGEGYRFAVRD